MRPILYVGLSLLMVLSALLARDADATSEKPQATLYDQYSARSYFSTYSTNTTTDDQDAEAADDFTIPPGQSWAIDGMHVAGVYANGPTAASASVRFYSGATLPEGLVGFQLNLRIAVGAESGAFVLSFRDPVILPAGHWWVSVQADTTGHWRWTNRTLTSGQPAAWRNPGGGYGFACQDWGRRLADCSYGSDDPDQAFRLLGELYAPPTATFTPAPPTSTSTPVDTPLPTETSTLPTSTPTTIPTPTIGPGCLFSDVCPPDYFFQPVEELVRRGAVSGYGDNTFRPFNNTTRAQLCKIVVIAEGWTVPPNPPRHFIDVPQSDPFFRHGETAYQHGMISGYDDETFRPYAEVTRGQITKIVVSAAGWDLYSGSVQHFTDVPPSLPFYRYVETAYQHGVISGYNGGVFRWQFSATRGQIAKIVYLSTAGGAGNQK